MAVKKARVIGVNSAFTMNSVGEFRSELNLNVIKIKLSATISALMISDCCRLGAIELSL